VTKGQNELVRILFMPPVYLPFMGGLEVLSSQILAELSDRGHDVAVLTSVGDGDDPVDDVVEGVRVHRCDVHRAIQQRDGVRILRAQSDTWRFIRDYAPDVIHAHDAPPMLWMYLRVNRERPRPPILMTLHNVMSRQYDENHQGMPGLLTLLRDVDWLTGVSEDVVGDAVTLDPSVAGRITLIRNGVAEPALAPVPVPDGPPRFLAIGRLVRQKGFHRAIEAVAMLAARLPDVRLTVVGVGALRTPLERHAADLGVADHVHFAGAVDHDDIPKLLSDHIALVMPSRYEGLPLVALEAAWMGRPVVGTQAPGLALAVVQDETGVLVDHRDRAALARAMEDLALDRDRARRLGAGARRLAEKQWSLPACVDAYETLYRRLGTR
jgi:glycosyltransferase involved in cell wall biosynthesis